MCGICGTYNHKDPSVLHRMCQVMTHRGPDDEGYYVNGKIAMGMKRLSIIDLTTGHQPIYYEDKSIWLIANGEIYNYLDLRNSLENKGHRFSTRTDIETVVHLYEEYGEEFLKRLRGMFALAIWDNRNELLFLARDRLGIKSLYYYYKDGIFAFASEIKSLLNSGLPERRINKKAVNYFLSFASIPPPLTIIDNIHSLLPGHFLKFKKSTVTLSSFWDINYQADVHKEESYYIDGLLELLRESVKLRMISDVPLGMFLSGGIDSSGILALMRQLYSGSIKTFSIGFAEGGGKYNETGYAGKVAEHFGTEHHECTVYAGDLIKLLPKIIWAMDQPTGDGVNSYFISKFAREGVAVALSGTGGDELFAGYEWFLKILRWHNIGCYLDKMPGPINLFASHIMQYMGYNFNISSFESIYRRVRMLYNQEEVNRLFSPSFTEDNIKGPDSYDPLAFYAECADKTGDILHKISYMQMKLDMPNLLLRDIDVMSMIHSLEVRVPYLDHKIVEFAAAIPSNMIMKSGKGKYILLKGLSKLLPKEILERKKMGFIFPIDYWLKSPLKRIIDQVLSRESIQRRGIFRYESIRHIMNEFYRGKAPYFKLWNIVVLELWHRLYIDNDPASGIPDRIEDIVGL